MSEHKVTVIDHWEYKRPEMHGRIDYAPHEPSTGNALRAAYTVATLIWVAGIMSLTVWGCIQ